MPTARFGGRRFVRHWRSGLRFGARCQPPGRQLAARSRGVRKGGRHPYRGSHAPGHCPARPARRRRGPRHGAAHAVERVRRRRVGGGSEARTAAHHAGQLQRLPQRRQHAQEHRRPRRPARAHCEGVFAGQEPGVQYGAPGGVGNSTTCWKSPKPPPSSPRRAPRAAAPTPATTTPNATTTTGCVTRSTSRATAASASAR